MIVREYIKNTILFFRNNAHLGPSLILFLLGLIFLSTSKFTTAAGALFGASASLLGAWISDFNTRKKESNSKKQNEIDAINYLTPELSRTITRLLYIQQRAIVNYSQHSSEYHKILRKGKSPHQEPLPIINLGDIKNDFIPYLPLLYPHAKQLQFLSGKKSTALAIYYDSLFELELFVKDWWQRDGQLSSNIFNQISHLSEKSLKLALNCLNEISDIEEFNHLSKQIDDSLKNAGLIRTRQYNDFVSATNIQK